MDLLFLSQADVARVLTVELAFEANREAYMAYSSGNAIQPPIVSMEFRDDNGEMDIKSGYSGLNKTVGVKILSGFWDNPRNFDLPISMGLMTLFDGRSGRPLCVLEAGMITYYRSAAAGAYAATLLARKDAARLAVIGTGGLARMHLIATKQYFDIRDAYIYSNAPEQKAKYIADFQAQYPDIRFHDCTTAQEAVEQADIITTATPANKAIVMDAWIRSGTHINAFGCDMTGKQELEPSIFTHAKVVVDNLTECVRRGETQHCIREGLLKQEDIHAEIGEIALGQKPGRINDHEITIFDSTGMSLQDISTASRIYEKAMELGIGTKVSMQ